MRRQVVGDPPRATGKWMWSAPLDDIVGADKDSEVVATWSDGGAWEIPGYTYYQLRASKKCYTKGDNIYWQSGDAKKIKADKYFRKGAPLLAVWEDGKMRLQITLKDFYDEDSGKALVVALAKKYHKQLIDKPQMEAAKQAWIASQNKAHASKETVHRKPAGCVVMMRPAAQSDNDDGSENENADSVASCPASEPAELDDEDDGDELP
eukprot:6490059-Pyramimonas_sp.AAC.1